jgi:hypothetical protein
MRLHFNRDTKTDYCGILLLPILAILLENSVMLDPDLGVEHDRAGKIMPLVLTQIDPRVDSAIIATR